MHATDKPVALMITDRISGPAIDAYQNLRGKFQQDVDLFLSLNPQVRLTHRIDVVDAYLRWNGLIGFAADVIELVQETHKP
jgi:hypothetical protein